MADEDPTLKDSVNLLEQEQSVQNEALEEIRNVTGYSSQIQGNAEIIAYSINAEMESLKEDFSVVSNKIVEKFEEGLAGKAESVLKNIKKDLLKKAAIIIFFVVGIISYFVFYFLLHLIDRLGLTLVIASVLLLTLLIIPEVSKTMRVFLRNYEEQITSFARDILSPYIEKNTPSSKAQGNKIKGIIKFLTTLSKSTIEAASVVSTKVAALLDLQKKIAEINAFKKEYKYALERYSLSSNDIDDFITASLSKREWITQLSQHISKILFPENSTSATTVLEIMYYDSFDENFKDVLLKSLEETDREFFARLVFKHLSSNETLDNTDLELLTKIFHKPPDSFSLSKVTTLFYQLRERFKAEKNYLLRAIKFLGKELEDNFLQFYRIECKSTECDDFDFEVLAKELKVDPSSIRIVYYSFKNPEKGKALFKQTPKQRISNDIAQALMDGGKVPQNIKIGEVKIVVEGLVELDPDKISLQIKDIADIFALVEKIDLFASGIGLKTDLATCKEYILKDYSKIILNARSSQGDQGHIMNLANIIKRLLNLDSISQIANTNEIGGQLPKVLAVIFENMNHDVDYTLFNKEAQKDWILTKALYLFSQKSAEKLESELGNTLFDSISESMNPEKEISLMNDNIFLKFQQALSNGIFPSYPALVSGIFNNYLQRLDEDGISEKELEDVKILINNILNQSLSEDKIRNLLIGRAIQAYMITVPSSSSKPAILEELDKTDKLKKIANEFAESENDERYLQLTNFTKGSGLGTRIGIISPDLLFENFTRLFDKFLQELFKMNPYPIFVTKISMSETSSQILVKRGSTDGIFEVVKNLVTKYYSEREQLALYESTVAQNEELTARELIIRILESEESDIALLIEPKKLASAKNLILDLDTRKITDNLLNAFQVKSVGELCLKLYDEVNVNNKESVEAKIRKVMIDNLKEGNKGNSMLSLSRDIVSIALKVAEVIFLKT